MPILDLETPALTQGITTPKGFAVTPGKIDIDHGSDAPVERPAWSSTLSAAFRQDNTVGSFFAGEDRHAPIYKEPGFNPWDAIKGTKYEPNWASFQEVRNTRHADQVKAKIDREQEDRKLLDSAPWWQSLPSQIVAGVVDLPSLIPGGAFVRGVKGGFSIGRSALSVGTAAGVSTMAQETALQGFEETRTLKESGFNIGASVLLGGLLGVSGAKFLSRVEWNGAVAAMERELAGEVAPAVSGAGVSASAGAAAVRPLDIEGNTIAGRAAGAVAAATTRLNPALRLLQSPSAAVREVGTQLFENSLYLKKNFAGVASDPAVETLMKEWNGGLANAVRSTQEAFPEYVKAGGQLGRDEFRQAVGRAMRRGDIDLDPQVAKIAQNWRSQVFDPLKEAAIEAKLLPEDVTVETAASYFSRMWNRNKLIAREAEFKDITTNWLSEQVPKWAEDFDKETLARSTKLQGDKLREYQLERRLERDARFEDVPGTVRGIADEVFNTLTGKSEQGVRPEYITVKARGPLKERTFNIPDHLIEDFLEHDVEKVGRRYVRVMGADVELANKFGSVDMKDQIAKIREDYNNLRQGITDEKKLTKLGAQEKTDVRDLEALRDLLRGTRNESPLEHSYARMARGFNHFNYLRSMGEVVLASLTDSVRPAMVHGLGQFLSDVPQFATNLKGVRLSVGEAELAGNVAEKALGTRLATLSEIIDPYASRGPTEAFLENMTNVASKWNGIRMWTDWMKSVAAVMTQNRILRNAENFGAVKDRERTYLAYLGIDQSMAERIAKQFSDHGETIDRVRVANTEEWTDAVAVRTYRAAMNKDMDSIIVQKSVADVPLFASTPTGRMMLQFKSFALASHQRILLRGLQEDQSRFVGGMAALTMMGMFQTWVKAIAGNRTEKLEDITKNPGWWVGEGLDKSGLFSIPMELSNMFEKASGFNPMKTPIKSFDEGSAISQKNQNRSVMGSLGGPTAGLIDDASSVAGIPKKMLAGDEVTQGQRSAAERLIPFNSYYGMRQMLRYLVNPPQ